MPKYIKRDVRKVVLKVRDFCALEKEHGGPVIPFRKVHARVSAATGISLHSVSNIVKQGKYNQVETPGKHRKTRNDKMLLDSFHQGILRRKIHEYYNVKKEIPTLKKLHQELKQAFDIKGGQEVLRRHVKMIGFKYRKTIHNRRVLVENNNISAWRSSYLQALKHNDEVEKLPRVYLDETYVHTGITAGTSCQTDGTDGVSDPVTKGQRFIIVHAGGEQGFVDNAALVFKSQRKHGDYHDDMNHGIFEKWVTEKLAPNLKKPSLIIMDSASYHNSCLNKVPNINFDKCEIMNWLRERNIGFSLEMTKPQLLEIVKRNKPEPVYTVDDILEASGHKVLRLPPYHNDLNPFEMVWASTKNSVAEMNIGKPPSAISHINILDALKTITSREMKSYCEYIKKIEDEYRKNDGYLDKLFVIQVLSDSDDSSDDDESNDGEIYDNLMECDDGALRLVKKFHNYNKKS